MPRPMGHIRILISARVLLNLEEADAIFKEHGPAEYADYMRARGKYEKDFVPELGGRKFEKGPLWEFAKAALALNKPGQPPVVDIGIFCKDTVKTSLPIFLNLEKLGMNDVYTEFRFATGGKALTPANLQSFDTDLLLSRNADDVQMAVDNGVAAAVVTFPPAGTEYKREPGPLRFWLDFDAVVADSSSEVFFAKNMDLKKYLQHEGENFNVSMKPGPFTDLVAKMSALNQTFENAEDQPFELSLLTARTNEAASRVTATTETLKIEFNGVVHFVGSTPKGAVLEAHKPDFYADDQEKHLNGGVYCPTGLVPYATGSEMDLFRKQAAEITGKKEEPTAETKPVPPKPPGHPGPRARR